MKSINVSDLNLGRQLYEIVNMKRHINLLMIPSFEKLATAVKMIFFINLVNENVYFNKKKDVIFCNSQS